MLRLKMYFICLLVFCTIDFLWLGWVARPWYNKEIGHLLSDSIRWVPAIVFYALYAAGILIFAVYPSLQLGDWKCALFYGAFLGLVSYATYDLTNLAIMKTWPPLLAITDIIWGTFLTGTTSLILYWISKE